MYICRREPLNTTSKRQMSRSWVLLKCVIRSWKTVTEALRNCKIYQSSLEQNRAVILQSDKCHSSIMEPGSHSRKGEIKEVSC